MNRHFFWSNKFFLTAQIKSDYTQIRDDKEKMAEKYNIDINILQKHGVDVRLVLRNMVVPEIGKIIFDEVNK